MDIQTISIVLAGVGIFIAAINSVISSRHAAEERQRQAFMELYATYRDKDFRVALWSLIYYRDAANHEEYWAKYGSTNVETLASDNVVAAFYEGIGFFVKNGWIKMEYVEDMMAESVIWAWEKIGHGWLGRLAG